MANLVKNVNHNAVGIASDRARIIANLNRILKIFMMLTLLLLLRILLLKAPLKIEKKQFNMKKRGWSA
jgi:hypothetical protein